MPKSIPQLGDSNWGTPLNAHISQLQNPANGGINSFDQFSGRPTKKLSNPSVNLDLDDTGLSYLYTQTGNIHQWNGTTWKVLNESVINVKDYGAVGDGLGKTPAELGMDIDNEVWNSWGSSIFKTNRDYSPYYANSSNTFIPPRLKPFSNNDTWDYIGIMRAFGIGKSIFIPSGDFKINLSQADRGGYNGLLIMSGQEQNIYGAGRYATKISPKEDYQYFNSNNTNSSSYYNLFTVYRNGGPATSISDINFEGPINYTTNSKNLTLINYTTNSKNLTLMNLVNVNGLTIKDCWFSVADIGMSWTTNCSDCFIKGVTTEYLFSSSIYIDTDCDVSIDFCNFWASASNINNQFGVNSLSHISITNSRFIEFGESSIKATGGKFCNNNITAKRNGINMNFSGDTVFIGNQIIGTSNSPILRIGTNSTVSGNYFNIIGQHSCIDLSNGVNAKNVIISNNTLIKTDIISANQDNTIFTSIIDGVSYFGAADSSCLITNNICKGNFQSTLGNANIIKNIINGTLV
jgi:hypothetical protein